MMEKKDILQEISDLTYTIETEYPELYRSLDEDPMTLPDIAEPVMDSQVLHDYLDELKALLGKYISVHGAQ